MQGLDPVANGQTTTEEIERCQADPEARLKLSDAGDPASNSSSTRGRATRRSRSARTSRTRSCICCATIRNCPTAQISKLIGTTKPTIAAVRDRTHWNSPNIKPRHPVSLGLCTMEELDRAVTRARRLRGEPERQETDSEESEQVET